MNLRNGEAPSGHGAFSHLSSRLETDQADWSSGHLVWESESELVSRGIQTGRTGRLLTRERRRLSLRPQAGCQSVKLYLYRSFHAGPFMYYYYYYINVFQVKISN